MLSITKRRATAGALALACLVPASAEAKTRSEALYNVTFQATLKEEWQANEDYADDCQLLGIMCTRTENGKGSTKLTLRSKRPTRMLMMRGFNGRPPAIGVGTGEGIPLTGSILQTGSLVTDYGGPWEKANPDRKRPDEGCGERQISGSANFAWRGRNQVAPSVVQTIPEMACPTGPGIAWDWANDESPSLGDVLAQASPRKFLGTKQFTISGRKSWSGQIEPTNRQDKMGHYRKSATTQSEWAWSATFRLVGNKKKKR